MVLNKPIKTIKEVTVGSYMEPVKLTAKEVLPATKEQLNEYAELIERTGIFSSQLLIMKFENFLIAEDIPVYNLQEVISYMDEKARVDGWEWRPLRAKDYRGNIEFGKNANDGHPSSDYYRGRFVSTNGDLRYAPSSFPYDKEIPLHALRKVAKIDAAFNDQVGLFVSDYKARLPDPFMMAVISNDRVREGIGRYVIDFWSEPGFGLQSQLK